MSTPTIRPLERNGQLPKMTKDQLEENIRRIVERDRMARGLGADEVVITRKATPDELLAIAERDARRPMDQVLEQPIRRPGSAEPARSPAMTTAPPPTAISKPTTTRTAPQSRVAPHVYPSHARPVEPQTPDGPLDAQMLERMGFARVDPRPPKPVVVQPIVILGKNGILRINKVALEAFGRLEDVAVLIHPTSREIALVKADAGPLFRIRHLRTGNANVAIKAAAQQLELLGAAHIYIPKKIEPGVLLINLAKDEVKITTKGSGA